MVAFATIVRMRTIPSGRWVGSDSLYHLFIAKEIRRLGHLPTTIDRFLVEETYTYPPLHHLLISVIPERWDAQSQKLGYVYDAITSLAIGLATYYSFGWIASILAVVIYFASPFSTNAYLGASPVPLGILFVTLFALVSASISPSGGSSVVLFIGISTVLVCGAVLSHRSSTQTMFALVVSETIYLHTLEFLVPLVAGLALAALVMRRRFYIQIADHVRFLRGLAELQMNIYSNLWKQREFRRILAEHLWPRTVVINFPLLLFLPAFFFLKGSTAGFLLVWVIGVLAIYLLWLPGRGYRQLGSAVPPLCILSAWLAVTFPVTAIGVVGIPLALAAAKYITLVRPGKMFVSENYLSACEFLIQKGTPADVVLSIPLGESYSLLYFTKCRILQGSGGDSRGLIFNRWLHSEVDGKSDISEVLKRFKPRFILRQRNSNTKLPATLEYANDEFEILAPLLS